ncbi:hypothetical protein JCM19000A_33490 [Silvimonas sp. JCM 19000]
MDLETLIRFLFPDGTCPASRPPDAVEAPSWHTCPNWPVDVFGFAACVLDKTGLLQYIGRTASETAALQPERLRQQASDWQAGYVAPARVVKAWDFVWSQRTTLIDEVKNQPRLQYFLHYLFRCAEPDCGLDGRPERYD